MSEPARSDDAPRPLDVRVGSATNALQPVAGAARELGAGPAQWLEMLVIAGAAVRAVCEAAGIHNILTKSYGTSNQVTVVKAAIKALSQLRTKGDVERLRGVALT